jgi:nuclear pore complex protein Nup160
MSLGGHALHDSLPSGPAKALMTSNITQIVTSRHSLARNVLLVAIFALSESDPSAEDEESEQLVEVLARALVTYHRYRVLKWVCDQTGEEARESSKSRRGKRRQGGDDILAEGLGGLLVRDRDIDDGGYASDGYDLSYSLLHSLFARQFELPSMTACLSPILSASIEFLSTVGLVSVDRDEGQELDAEKEDLQLIQAVLMDGHAILTGKMAELYPMNSGIGYLRGRANLEAGEWEAAAGLLQRAAAGCTGK